MGYKDIRYIFVLTSLKMSISSKERNKGRKQVSQDGGKKEGRNERGEGKKGGRKEGVGASKLTLKINQQFK